jgi:exosortase/archaeosortase family protein
MKKRVKTINKFDFNLFSIPLRYVILLVFVILLPLLYKLLTPATIQGVVFILKFIYSTSINSQTIILNNNYHIEIISACVAGSAYLLLLILNLLTPMKTKQRIYSIVFSMVVLYIFNVLRIVFLSVLFVNKFKFYDITHKIFWYFISTIFIVLIWFFVVRLFKIKNVPFYTDVKSLCRNIKF